MAAELAFIDGKAQFIGKDEAWHGAGTVKGKNFGWKTIEKDAPLTAAPAILVPMAGVLVEQGKLVPFDNLRATVRVVTMPDGSVRYVGVGAGLTDIYVVETSKDAFDFGQHIRKVLQQYMTTGEAALVSCGTLFDGALDFFTYDAGSISVGGEEIVTHLTITNGYNGKHSLRALFSDTIVVCNNTRLMAEAGAHASYNIPHKGDVEGRKAFVVQLIEAHGNHLERLEQTVSQLQAVKISMRRWDMLLDTLVPTPADTPPRTLAQRQQVRDAIQSIYKGTIPEGFRGTGWGAVQAVNTYEVWASPVRDRDGSGIDRNVLRAQRQVEGLLKGDPHPLTRQMEALVLASK